MLPDPTENCRKLHMGKRGSPAMLDVDDREYVKALLIQRATMSGSAKLTLISGLPLDVSMQVEDGLNPATLVERVLVLCEADGWRRDPTTLARLLSLLGNIGRVPVILTKLVTPPLGAASDPFATTILDTGQPFLDRLATRTVLRTWTTTMPVKQIMVVAGPSKGKSYTVEFVRHIVRDIVRTTATDVRSVLVSLERDQAASCGQGELATEIVSEMGGTLKAYQAMTRIPPPGLRSLSSGYCAKPMRTGFTGGLSLTASGHRYQGRSPHGSCGKTRGISS